MTTFQLPNSVAKVPTCFCSCGSSVLAVGDKSGTISLFSCSSLSILAKLTLSILTDSNFPPSITCITSPLEDLPTFGSQIAVGCSDGSIRIISLDISTSSLSESVIISPTTDMFTHKGSVTSILWDPVDRIFTTGSDQTLKIWDSRNGAHIDTQVGHQGQVNHVSILNWSKSKHDISDSIVPITTGIDRTVRIWNLPMETHLCFKGPQNCISIECVVSLFDVNRSINTDDRKYFITGQQDGSIYGWVDNKKRPLFNMIGLRDSNWIVSMAVSNDKSVVAVGGWDVVRLFTVSLSPFKLELFDSIKIDGCANQLLFEGDKLIVLVGREHKSGRWNVKGCNQIMIVDLS
ncbi:hypothetical protein RCL1_007182 [Eukaryota sp. TZLM3-RCL]